MNIVIDVLAILGPDSKNRGIGNYATNQFRELLSQDKENCYFLLNFYEDTSLKDILMYGDNVSEHYFYTGPNHFLSKDPGYRDIMGALILNFIKEHSIDIYYITSPFEGVIGYKKEWFSDIRYIATVYDIIPYVYQERYLPDKGSVDWYMSCVDTLRGAEKLLAISQSVKDDLAEHLAFDKDKIDVIYSGVDSRFRKFDLEEQEKDAIKKKFGIRDKFIMCTGGDDDRKNMAGLIEAYSMLPQALQEEYQLVLVCKLIPAAVKRYSDVIKKHNVERGVVLTNFVTDKELVELYNMAEIQAFVSICEGFGLPVVEAMACGVPVLTSNNSSLGEIAQGAAVLVNPFDIKDISRGLQQILEQENREKLIQRGYERIERFTWEKTAGKTLENIRGLSLREKKKKRLRHIACFTPLPPLKSGIADYSADILEELSKTVDVDVFVDEGFDPTPLSASNIVVFSHKKFRQHRKKYDAVLYQMGNSDYHEYMLPYIEKYHGTVMLHDLNLHGLLGFISYWRDQDVERYKKYLRQDYSDSVVEDIIQRVIGHDQNVAYDYPVNRIVTDNAEKIIVHSAHSKRNILSQSLSYDVSMIHLYAKVKDENPFSDGGERKRQAKRILGIAEDSNVIAAFGHVHETKRILPLIRAMSDIIEVYPDAKLFLVGEIDKRFALTFEPYLDKYKMKDHVVVTGYTELNAFLNYMDAADICLNLRYPHNGESSGSLMRLLAKGKCVVLNAIGSFDEVPDNCCVKLPSPREKDETEESQEIQEALLELLDEPEKISEIGANAWKYAKENLALPIIAKKYLAVLGRERRYSLTREAIARILQDYYSYNESGQDSFKFSYTLAYAQNSSCEITFEE